MTAEICPKLAVPPSDTFIPFLRKKKGHEIRARELIVARSIAGEIFNMKLNNIYISLLRGLKLV